jgi:hypothetical protein
MAKWLFHKALSPFPESSYAACAHSEFGSPCALFHHMPFITSIHLHTFYPHWDCPASILMAYITQISLYTLQRTKRKQLPYIILGLDALWTTLYSIETINWEAVMKQKK